MSDASRTQLSQGKRAPGVAGRRSRRRTLTSSRELNQDPSTVNYYVDHLTSWSAHPAVLTC